MPRAKRVDPFPRPRHTTAVPHLTAALGDRPGGDLPRHVYGWSFRARMMQLTMWAPPEAMFSSEFRAL